MRSLLLLTLSLCQVSPAIGPVSPEDSIAQMQTMPGVQVELVAAEPQVFDPVALAFDEAGRLFVVENRGYPTNGSGLGAVIELRDADDDGFHEERVVFAEGFDFPNGLMPWRGGLLLTCAPHVYFLQDTDGDGRADLREPVLSGFSEGGSTQLRVSHPTLGIDNRIYFTNGLSGGKVSITGLASGEVDMGAYDLRYDPFAQRLERAAGQAQFGLSFDDFGNRFICSNRKHVEHVVLEPEEAARNPHQRPQLVADIPEHGGAARIFALSEARTTAYAHAGTFTAACGLVLYRGASLPAEYSGAAFVCEPTGALVHCDLLEPRGATFSARRHTADREFLASRDDWFRPVFLANGPDGALYLCDMYRETIEHPTYLPPEVAAVTNFERGNDRGRIYRLRGEKALRPELVPAQTPEALVAALESSNGWTRDTAHRLILERQDRALAGLLRALVHTAEAEVTRVHALRLLEGLDVLEAADLQHALESGRPHLREHALRMLRGRDELLAALEESVIGCATDDAPRVRFAAALVLDRVQHEAVPAALAEAAMRGLEDPWMQAAVLGAASGRVGAMADEVLKRYRAEEAGGAAFLQELSRLHARSEAPAGTAAFTERLLGQSYSDADSLAALSGIAAGVRENGVFPEGSTPLARLIAASASSANLSQRIQERVTRAAALAIDTEAPLPTRIAAVRLLGAASFDVARDALSALLAPIAPRELQAASVRALGQMQAPEVAGLLVQPDVWGAYLPSVRDAAMEMLLQTPERTRVLMDAIASGQVPAWSVPPRTRAVLQGSKDEEIRAQARTLFAALKPTDRAKVYEEYRPVLELTPDIASGHAVFVDICSRCHVFNGEGHEVGPDLTGIQSQPLESILLHILIPNSLMLEGYETYVVETDDFENYAGIIVAETETTITLRQGLGIEATIERASITRMEATGLSMMPDELEKGMSRQQLRDLLGFLKGETAAADAAGDKNGAD